MRDPREAIETNVVGMGEFAELAQDPFAKGRGLIELGIEAADCGTGELKQFGHSAVASGGFFLIVGSQ